MNKLQILILVNLPTGRHINRTGIQNLMLENLPLDDGLNLTLDYNYEIHILMLV